MGKLKFSRKDWIWRNWFKKKPDPPPLDYILQNKSKTKIIMSSQKTLLSPASINELRQVISQIEGRAVSAAVDAEAVDTGADIVQLAQIMEAQFGDGFQWVDLFGLIPAQPIVNELIRDFLVAVSSISKTAPPVTVDLALAIYAEAKRRGPIGKVSRQICRVFYWAATTFYTGGQILDLVDIAKDRSVAVWNNLPLLPDEFEN